MTGGHGDAAFADWIWLASYSFRYGGRHQKVEHHPADTPAAAPAATATVTKLDRRHENGPGIQCPGPVFSENSVVQSAR
jgi:hypothetical protein